MRHADYSDRASPRLVSPRLASPTEPLDFLARRRQSSEMRRPSWPLPKSHSWRHPSFGSSESLLAGWLACVAPSQPPTTAHTRQRRQDPSSGRGGAAGAAARQKSWPSAEAPEQDSRISPAKASERASRSASAKPGGAAVCCRLPPAIIASLAFHLASRISLGPLSSCWTVSYRLGSARHIAKSHAALSLSLVAASLEP